MKTLAILSALISAGATHGTATLALGANVADGETVTIGTTVFEFDTDDDVTEGNVLVDVSGGVTPAAAATALEAAINAASLAVTAKKVGTAVVVIHDLPGQTLATTETLAGGGNAWSSATLIGGTAPSDKIHVPVTQTHTATAADVTAGVIAMGFGAPVEAVEVSVRTAAGIPKAWVGAVTVDSHLVVVDNSGATDFAENDVVTFTAKLAIVA